MKLMKKVLAVMLTAVMCFGMFSVPTFAFGGMVSTHSISDATKFSDIFVDGDKVTLDSIFSDTVSYDILYLKQYLEVKGSWNSWSQYKGSVFSKRLRNTSIISMESVEVQVPAGTYRVYCEVTATPKNGSPQTVKFYSGEATVS